MECEIHSILNLHEIVLLHAKIYLQPKKKNSLNYFQGRTHGSTFFFLYVRTKHEFKSSCREVGNLAKKLTILKAGLRILDRNFHLSSMVSLGMVLKPKSFLDQLLFLTILSNQRENNLVHQSNLYTWPHSINFIVLRFKNSNLFSFSLH